MSSSKETPDMVSTKENAEITWTVPEELKTDHLGEDVDMMLQEDYGPPEAPDFQKRFENVLRDLYKDSLEDTLIGKFRNVYRRAYQAAENPSTGAAEPRAVSEEELERLFQRLWRITKISQDREGWGYTGHLTDFENAWLCRKCPHTGKLSALDNDRHEELRKSGFYILKGPEHLKRLAEENQLPYDDEDHNHVKTRYPGAANVKSHYEEAAKEGHYGAYFRNPPWSEKCLNDFRHQDDEYGICYFERYHYDCSYLVHDKFRPQGAQANLPWQLLNELDLSQWSGYILADFEDVEAERIEKGLPPTKRWFPIRRPGV
jgi:hypothetical protein